MKFAPTLLAVALYFTPAFGADSASKTIDLQPAPKHTATVFTLLDNSGGTFEQAGTVQAGDRESDGLVQGFFGYDLATLPRNAVITSAQLTVRQELTHFRGTPYVLGKLYVEPGLLNAQGKRVLNKGALLAGARVLSTDATGIIKTVDITALLQQQWRPNVASALFRVRFEKLTDKDKQTDRADFTPGALRVTYTLAPPVNGKIAFVSKRDGLDDIYSINADGSGLKRLTNDPGFDIDPCYSADGSKIAFVSNRNYYFDVFVMNADGSGERRVTDCATLSSSMGYDASTSEPSFSPDGQNIIFSGNFAGDWDIYQIRIDGGILRRLTSAPGWDGYPSYSPDGKKIAFCSTRESAEGELYVMNSDGTGVKRLTNQSPVWDAEPTFTADSSKIIFSSNPEENLTLYQVNVDGIGYKRLAIGSATSNSPDVSPDGRKIVFARDGNLWVMNVDGSGAALLLSNTADDASPTWAPAR